MSEEDDKDAKLQIKKDLLQEFPEDFNENEFKASVGKSLKYLFNKHIRYVNMDEFLKKVGDSRNINLLSILDCCREKPPTKGEFNNNAFTALEKA